MTKGVPRQPEGVTPAYSQAGSEKRRKRRTRDTSSFYGARAPRFRTDNVDPIENTHASCLKAIDCFSSNMSETAAPCRPPLFSFSHRVDGKFVGELYKCGFSECQRVTCVRKYAADVNLKERKKHGYVQKGRACVGSDARRWGHF